MTWEHSGKIAIAGIGFSPIERRTRTPLGSFALTAAQNAVEDCGLTLSDIDGLATYPQAPFLNAVNRNGEDVITVKFFLGQPRLRKVTWYSQAGEGLIVTAVRDAVDALIAGACKYALIWRAHVRPARRLRRNDNEDRSRRWAVHCSLWLRQPDPVACLCLSPVHGDIRRHSGRDGCLGAEFAEQREP